MTARPPAYFRPSRSPFPAPAKVNWFGVEATGLGVYRWAMALGQNPVRAEHVGRRVSFQYELPNGYVGEVVGTLEQWDEPANTYLVRNRRGEVVRVPALGVRFGKVIPG